MALGTNSGTPKIYLTVGFGKIRQKTLDNKQRVDANTPKAVKRLTQSGAESWALEFDFIEGLIDSIFYKEDREYGDSFEVVIEDDTTKYQLSFPEESRFWVDFMSKLPKINLNEIVKITAYDFQDKEGKRKVGTSIEQAGEKITSFYSSKNEDGTWNLLNGYPTAKDVNFKDKDEIKVYSIKVKKFLRGEFNRLFADKFKSSQSVGQNVKESEHESPFSVGNPDPESGLPF
jgi:hypothetical protein